MSVDTSEKLRAYFKVWREETGTTLREVEWLTGISNPLLSQFETGHTVGIGFDNGMKLIRLIFAKRTKKGMK